MIIVMKHTASLDAVHAVASKINTLGLKAHISTGNHTSIIGIIGDNSLLCKDSVCALEGVDKILSVSEPYKLANIKFKPTRTEIKLDHCTIGGKQLAIIGGPCAIESREQLLESANFVKASGASILRGGAYKPRTSPYSFQGLEEEGLRYMKEAHEKTGLSTICEVTSIQAVETAKNYVQLLQVGARNMQNFELLKAVGKTNLPVVLKRGPASSIEDWLNAAEYIMNEGNVQVILCERGIRTFETATRNTLDLSAVAVVKSKSHLPVIVDPSHAAGTREYIASLAKAAIAVGADGLMIEAHPNPAIALSDGPQSLSPLEFEALIKELKPIAYACGRSILCE